MMDAQNPNYGSSDLHQQTPHHGTSHGLVGDSHRPNWASKLTALILVVAGLGVLVAMIVGVITRPNSLVKQAQYQAVFLTNGQVYFGKLATANRQYVSLTNVYYLQQSNQVQQSTTPPTTAQNNLSLVKLGNELHGPEDQMFIASSQILFWENLKDSGKVVQAIKKSP